MSMFTAVEMAPRDPILGLNEQLACRHQPRTRSTWALGVYYDDNGKLPSLECVKAAEAEHAQGASPRAATCPSTASRRYDNAGRRLVLGADSEPVATGPRGRPSRPSAAPAASAVGADFLKKLNPERQGADQRPELENHRALFTNAGFPVESYPYYDAAKPRPRTSTGMLAALERRPGRHHRRAARLLPQPDRLRPHPRASGTRSLGVVKATRPGALPGHGLPGLRRRPARKTARPSPSSSAPASPFCVRPSFSKSFSLYGERVGALSVLCENKEEAGARAAAAEDRHPHQLQQPAHPRRRRGGRACSNNPELCALWEKELAEMRVRIKAMRQKLVDEASRPPA